MGCKGVDQTFLLLLYLIVLSLLNIVKHIYTHTYTHYYTQKTENSGHFCTILYAELSRDMEKDTRNRLEPVTQLS